MSLPCGIDSTTHRTMNGQSTTRSTHTATYKVQVKGPRVPYLH